MTATARVHARAVAPARRARARAQRASSARVASARQCARFASISNASTVDGVSSSTSAATTPDDDVPIWERRELERKAADAKGGLPWPAYLLLSVIVLIAATGSMFEYAYKNPIFGVVGADSGLYAPILGWFVFTGFPLAGFFWKKGIDGANEASEAQDKMDGY